MNSYDATEGDNLLVPMLMGKLISRVEILLVPRDEINS
jgi:hypothetical protein